MYVFDQVNVLVRSSSHHPVVVLTWESKVNSNLCFTMLSLEFDNIIELHRANVHICGTCKISSVFCSGAKCSPGAGKSSSYTGVATGLTG